MPCTMVNAVIAVVLSGLFWFGTIGLGVAAYGPGIGVGSLVLFIGAIYIRGYLVPGTPELTKKYLPLWALTWFDKDPDPPEVEFSVEPEAVLHEAGVIEPCRNGTDLCLSEEFLGEWNERIENVRTTGKKRESLAEILDANPAELEIEAHDDARLARLDGMHVGQWESEGALVADLAAEPLMGEYYDGWSDLEVHERSRVLVSLRIFLEECPTCGGDVLLTEEEVESCCSTMDVVAAVCRDCESRLLEVQQTQ